MLSPAWCVKQAGGAADGNIVSHALAGWKVGIATQAQHGMASARGLYPKIVTFTYVEYETQPKRQAQTKRPTVERRS